MKKSHRWIAFTALMISACLLTPTALRGQPKLHSLEHRTPTHTSGLLRPGVVVEQVQKGWAADRAGIKKGDLLLTWSRGDSEGEIDSPFTMWWLGAEQSPLGPVSIRGMRGSEPKLWIVEPDGPDDWAMTARPNFVPSQMRTFRAVLRRVAIDGKTPAITSLWTDSSRLLWLRAWMALQVAKALSSRKRWQESDEIFEIALELAKQAGPCIAPVAGISWERNLESREDRTGLQQYEQELAKIDGSACGRQTEAAVLLSRACNCGSRDLTQLEEYAGKVLALRSQLGPESVHIVRALQVLSDINLQRGELDGAKDYANQALAIMEKNNPESLRVTDSLGTLALIAEQRGNLGESEALLRRSLAVEQRVVPNTAWIASTLGNLGNIAGDRGDPLRAETYYRQADTILHRTAPRGLLLGLNLGNLCWALREQRRLDEADQYCSNAVTLLRRVAQDSTYLADVLADFGDVSEAQDRLTKAAEYMREALTIRQRIAPSSLYLAGSFNDLGRLTDDLGDINTAAEYYHQALAIREKLAPGSTIHAETLAAFASVMRRKGQPDNAAFYYSQALDALESQTARLGGGSDARAGYRAKHEKYYAEYVDLLIAQHHPQTAFETLERSRARTLLETLAAAHVDVHQGANPALVEKGRSLQSTFKAESERRISLLTGKHTDEQIQGIEKEISDVTAEYQDVEAQLRASSPGYAALTQPQPLSAAEIQQQLLDPDTLLLEYSLGKEGSHVFAVTQDSLTAFELPPRKKIEQTARRLYTLLTTQNRRVPGETESLRARRVARAEATYSRAASELSRIILMPVADQLQGKRLLIVADGALHYVPFAALPEPDASTPAASVAPLTPLVLNHEIVNLPSASVLAVLRQQETSREPAAKDVAVLDAYLRDQLIGAMMIDFMSSHPLGVDTKQRICNGAQITGIAMFGLSVGADLAIEEALTNSDKVLLRLLAAGNVGLSLSGFCSQK